MKHDTQQSRIEELAKEYAKKEYGDYETTSLEGRIKISVSKKAFKAGYSTRGEDAVELVKNIQHHIDMWSDEPERALRLVQKEIDAFNHSSSPSK